MKTKLYRLMAIAVLALGAGAATAEPEMRVSGRVNADGALPLESNLSDVETGSPLARPAISVSDSDPGVWEYLARVDSAVPKIQVFGSITNNTGSVLGDIEIPVLSVQGALQDTITLAPTIAGPYTVTIDMIVDGLLAIDGSSSRGQALLRVIPEGKLSSFDSHNYTTSGAIVDDTLSASYGFLGADGDVTIDIESSLFFSAFQIEPGVTVSGDFSQTAIIRLTITGDGGVALTPDDVAVSSDSGFFGTAPVPVPPALPLLGAALGGLWLRGRRRAAVR